LKNEFEQLEKEAQITEQQIRSLEARVNSEVKPGVRKNFFIFSASTLFWILPLLLLKKKIFLFFLSEGKCFVFLTGDKKEVTEALDKFHS
jgi:hypothetical protein